MKSKASRWISVCCALFVIGSLAMSIPIVRGYVWLYLYRPTIGARGDRNWWDAKMVLGDFFVHSLGKNYGSAHQLLSTRVRSTTTVKDVQSQWQVFERAHGSIRSWRSTSSKNNLTFPTYVSFNVTVTDSKAVPEL
jgi:hypothetical protein